MILRISFEVRHVSLELLLIEFNDGVSAMTYQSVHLYVFYKLQPWVSSIIANGHTLVVKSIFNKLIIYAFHDVQINTNAHTGLFLKIHTGLFHEYLEMQH
jgi:hypothetical protein